MTRNQRIAYKSSAAALLGIVIGVFLCRDAQPGVVLLGVLVAGLAAVVAQRHAGHSVNARSVLRALAWTPATIVAAVFTIAIYLFFVFDAQAYFENPIPTNLEGLKLPNISTYHLSDGPCAFDFDDAPTMSELAAAADELDAASLIDKTDVGFALSPASAAFFWFNEDRESRDHDFEASTDAMAAVMPFMDGLRYRFHGEENAERRRAQLKSKADAAINASAKSEAMLREIWLRHPRALNTRGLLDVSLYLDVLLTERRMKELAGELKQHFRTQGSFPKNLDGMTKDTRDAWDAQFYYEADGKKARIWSRGADHREGGKRFDADLSRSVDAPSAEPSNVIELLDRASGPHHTSERAGEQ